MLNQEILLNRLALIKLLFKTGIEQSKQPEPISSFSILSLHDSIEMFLKLLAEHLNIKSDKFSFIEYWDNIPTLTLKESCRTLNARRVNIKHKGLLPSKADIEASRVTAIDFFNQNSLSQFSIDFETVSLLTLVKYPTIKELLEIAQQALSKNSTDEAISNVAIAFDELLHVYEVSKSDLYGSPFFFGKSMTFQSSFILGIEDRKFAGFVDNVKESIESIRDAIKILSMGFDYRKYIKFNTLTPHVTRTKGGRHISDGWRKKKRTIENCQYCIDFVVECSIKLQDFDFDIKELIDTE